MTNPENIARITEFIKPGSTVYIATVDGTTPHVRPFQFQFDEDGKLWFCTANTKDIFSQIKANSNIELCFVSPDYVTMRVNGSVVMSENAAVKQKIISENELVRSIYITADNPIFSVFYLEHGDARISYLNGDPDKKFSF